MQCPEDKKLEKLEAQCHEDKKLEAQCHEDKKLEAQHHE